MKLFKIILILLGFVFINNAAAATCTYTKHSGKIACLSSVAVKPRTTLEPLFFAEAPGYLIANNVLSKNYVGGTTSVPRGVCFMRAPSTTVGTLRLKGWLTNMTCPSTLPGALSYTGPNAEKIWNCTRGNLTFHLTQTYNSDGHTICVYGKLTGDQAQCYWDSFWIYPDWVKRTVKKRLDKKTFDFFEQSAWRCN